MNPYQGQTPNINNFPHCLLVMQNVIQFCRFVSLSEQMSEEKYFVESVNIVELFCKLSSGFGRLSKSNVRLSFHPLHCRNIMNFVQTQSEKRCIFKNK